MECSYNLKVATHKSLLFNTNTTNNMIVEKSSTNPIDVNITINGRNQIKFYLMRFTKDTGREINERSCRVLRSYLKCPHRLLHLYKEYSVFSRRLYFGRSWRKLSHWGGGFEVWQPFSTSCQSLLPGCRYRVSSYLTLLILCHLCHNGQYALKQ